MLALFHFWFIRDVDRKKKRDRQRALFVLREEERKREERAEHQMKLDVTQPGPTEDVTR